MGQGTAAGLNQGCHFNPQSAGPNRAETGMAGGMMLTEEMAIRSSTIPVSLHVSTAHAAGSPSLQRGVALPPTYRSIQV